MSTPQQEQHFEKILKSSATFLQRWLGVPAEMWQLTSSLKTLQILVRRIGEEGSRNLLISCIDPIRLRGPVRWPDSDIRISRYPKAAEFADGFSVTDPKADVEIICGSVEVKENVKLY